MTYKVFISSGGDRQAQQQVQAVKAALWRISEFPLSLVTLDDLGSSQNEAQYLNTVRGILNDADMLLGIYNEEYGAVLPGYNRSHLELEYDLALESGVACFIFISQAARGRGDERMQAFRQRLSEAHVVYYFDTLEDLQAQVIVALHNFKRLHRQGRLLRPPAAQGFMAQAEAAAPVDAARDVVVTPPPATASFSTTEPEVVIGPAAPDALFESQVRRALNIVDDDLEALVRRAFEVHLAQQMTTPQPQQNGDTQMVKPLFGPPALSSQFRSDVFMIMPFRPQYDAVYQNIVIPTLAALNLTVKRGDEFSSLTGVIMQEVWAALNACRLVIAEVSEINANVYYELGIAHTLGKPAVLITQTPPEDLPFDIRHLRFIVYENTIPGGEALQNELKRAIIWILNDLREVLDRERRDVQ